ncbi:amino acid ABC transporter ATP-binding protein [soil metagenome]
MQIEVANLTRHYADRPALDGLELAVESDVRTLALIGPSGGGKSTFLRILGGLEVPDAGTVRVNGHRLPTAERDLLAYRRRNGFLFQAFNLFPHLSAAANIALPLDKVHGASAVEAQGRAAAILERFGLADHAAKRPAELSGGQQQRVGIARAIAHDPELLILDEPTSALDPEMTAEVLDLIRELAEAGQDIILSTHEMGFARAVADRVAFLADGKVVEDGSGEAVFGSPESPAAQRFFSRIMRW